MMICEECGNQIGHDHLYSWAFSLSCFQTEPRKPMVWDTLEEKPFDGEKHFCSHRCIAIWCAPILRNAIKDPEILQKFKDECSPIKVMEPFKVGDVVTIKDGAPL